MVKNCVCCGVAMDCHFNQIYCPACGLLKRRESKAAYKARDRELLKNNVPKKKPIPPAPSLSIAQVEAAARKSGISYGKYVAELEKSP